MPGTSTLDADNACQVLLQSLKNCVPRSKYVTCSRNQHSVTNRQTDWHQRSVSTCLCRIDTKTVEAICSTNLAINNNKPTIWWFTYKLSSNSIQAWNPEQFFPLDALLVFRPYIFISTLHITRHFKNKNNFPCGRNIKQLLTHHFHCTVPSTPMKNNSFYPT